MDVVDLRHAAVENGDVVVQRPLEIGERVRWRSLGWEVSNVGERLVTLFGREAANRGRTEQALIGYEAIERIVPPPLTYRIGDKNWDDADWRGMHDAYRLTLAQSRGSLGTAAWGRLVLEPYQLVPLQRIEQLPEPRLLIADDMGLGKTSEAGLILSRLLQRRRADRVLVVTRARPEPERWRDELLEKFGLDFEVINDGADYARLRKTVPAHLNLYASIPRLVISMHFASQAERLPDLERTGLRWDVVVIDEAHHLADRGGDTRLSGIGRVVSKAANALLLLTATPHDGKVASFASLIELIDDYAVADREHLQPRLIRPLMVRRLKSQVVKAGGERFVQPDILAIDVEPRRLKAEKHLEKGIRSYAKQLRDQQKLLERKGERGAASGFGFLESLLRKRLASSVLACRRTLEQRVRTLEGTQPLSPEEPNEDEPRVDDVALLDLLPNGKSEREVLADLIHRSSRIPDGTEGKLASLLDLVTAITSRREKVVVFTEYRDTLSAIVALLARQGLVENRQLLTYHGATTGRDVVRRRFLEDPEISVLAATDAASEGINLQLTCNHLIHVEVPWDPNRYEQRNGRIDRYGQRETPHIRLLVARGYVEQRAAEIVAMKMEQIAKDVGSVSNVAPFAQAVSIEKYLADNAGDGEEDVDAEAVGRALAERIDAAVADTRDAVPAELLAGDGFDSTDLAQVEAELAEVAAFAPSFEDVRLFITRYLAHEGGSIRQLPGQPGIFHLRLSESLRTLTGVDEIPRATFDRLIATAEANRPKKDRVAFLSPGHPVVMAALRRARSWALSPTFPSRVSWRRVGDDARAASLFTFSARYIDGRGETIEERLDVVAVGPHGKVSRDDRVDRQLLLAPEVRGMNTPAIDQALAADVPEAFDRLRGLADNEAQRRARARLKEIERQQQGIADQAFERLGEWRAKAAERIESRLDAQTSLLLDPVERRRHAMYERQIQTVAARADQRRNEISQMREVRLESVDPIGALVLLPPGGWPRGA